MHTFQIQDGYVWSFNEEWPTGKKRVAFICIFKDGSHSTSTQLVGPYLWAALLKGEGVLFSRKDSIPLLCLLLSSAEWCSGDNVNLITTCECVLYEWYSWRSTINLRICIIKIDWEVWPAVKSLLKVNTRGAADVKRLFKDSHQTFKLDLKSESKLLINVERLFSFWERLVSVPFRFWSQ